MITLKKLRWSNCFSYGENNEIDLNETRLTQIVGNNGAGKSSIPLILEEVLYNKNSKGVKKADIPNRELNKGYTIELQFFKDDIEYEVKVSRNANLKVKLLKDGEDISSHTATNTYKNLEEIIGIDFKVFSQLVYQNTTTSLQFLTSTDTNRKKFLISLLNLELYTDYFEIFKERTKSVGDDILRTKGKIETVENWFKNNKLTDTMVQDLQKLPEKSKIDEDKLLQLTAEIKNIDFTNKKIIQNNEYKDQLVKLNIQNIKEIPVSGMQDTTLNQEQITQAATYISSHTKEINKIEKLGEVCPTCEQQVDEEFKIKLLQSHKDSLKYYTSEKDKNTAALMKARENNSLFQEKEKKVKEWESLYRSIDKTLSTEPLYKEQILEEISDLKTAINKVENEIKLLIVENNEITKKNTRIQVVLEQEADFNNQLKTLSKELEGIELKYNDLDILKKAFSTNGLVAYKIENLVVELEELTNEYLSVLSSGKFTLNFVVSNDKLNVEITDNDKIIDITSLSSGELARVNTATLIAIRKLMSSISNTQINVLFLDEVISVLDEAGKEYLIEVLLNEELNTYLVSHGYTHPLLEKIEVTKNNKISVLEK